MSNFDTAHTYPFTVLTQDAQGNPVPHDALAAATADPSIATVTITQDPAGDGVVTPVAVGTTTLTVTNTAQDGTVTHESLPVDVVEANPPGPTQGAVASLVVTFGTPVAK